MNKYTSGHGRPCNYHKSNSTMSKSTDDTNNNTTAKNDNNDNNTNKNANRDTAAPFKSTQTNHQPRHRQHQCRQ